MWNQQNRAIHLFIFGGGRETLKIEVQLFHRKPGFPLYLCHFCSLITVPCYTSLIFPYFTSSLPYWSNINWFHGEGARAAQTVPSAIFLKVNLLWQGIVWECFQMSVPLCQLLAGDLPFNTLPQVYCINKQSLFEQDQWQQNYLLVSKKTLIMCTKGEGLGFDRPSPIPFLILKH